MTEPTVENVMVQAAPYPVELEDLVRKTTLEPGHRVTLETLDRGQGSEGLTLVVHVTSPDAYDHDKPRSVVHYFIVPAASYNRQSWQRWLFDRLCDVDLHERMEHFTIDGFKPYAPNHGPGHDPYVVRELTTDLDRRTSFRGEVNDDV